MSANFDNNLLPNNHDSRSSPLSPPISSSSSPSSSSDGSSSSSELNPSDALQSPLTGLLNFEGFSMPQMSNFGISNIDIPNFSNLPSLPTLPSFNMPNLQQRIPDLANNLSTNLANNLSNNLTNLRNLSTNMPTNLQSLTTNMPNFPNLSYLSQLTNVYTSAELQNLFNLFRISTNLPALPQLPPLFSAKQFSSRQLLKSWPHLRDSVRNMHRRLNDITKCFPENFNFCEFRDKRGVDFIRIYFLLSGFIYYYDTPINESSRTVTGSNNHNNQPMPSTSSGSNKHHHPINNRSNNRYEVINAQPLQPNSILVSSFPRIDSYEYDPKSSRFVLSIGTNLYYFDDHPEKSESPITPVKIETKCLKSKKDFRICPTNPDLVSYHCDGDIWCVNLKTFQEIKLTDASSIMAKYSSDRHSHNHTCDRNRITANQLNYNSSNIDDSHLDTYKSDAAPYLIGRPSHVIREEFRRHQGSWWRPETEYHVVNDSEDFSEYQILYEETDQSRVDLVNIPTWDGTIEEQRFPKAGRENAISRLKITKFKLSSIGTEMYDIVNLTVVDNFNEIFPQYQYLVRVGWLGQEAIWCQLLNRKQTHLVIAIISLSGSFKSQIIYEEKNETYWISPHDSFYFLNASQVDCRPLVEGSELTFIWSSEETGFRHLYLIKVKLTGNEPTSQLILKRQLTEGQWEVNEKDFWVDEEEMLIYFCGLKDTPLEKQLYTLSYADCLDKKNHDSVVKTKIRRLTELNYTQSNIAFNANCSIYVNIQSNISVPPFGFVNRIVPQTKFRRDFRRLPDSKRLALLLVNSFNYPFFETSHLDYLKSIGTRPSIMYDCQADLLPGLTKPELFCCKLTNGELIYGSVFKPEFMESGVRYPTVLEIYGGPEIQMVSNNFMSLRQPTRHLLSSCGYVVVIIDCRGSGRRGLSFESYTRHRMGQLEIADQVEVLKWLAKNTGYIDLNRVAIKGWSYGGYLALMALAQYPEVFKVAIAGAPVTNWHLYDTGYTERFMGTPDENIDGYQKGNVLNYVHLFPDQ